ncbi:MAG: hypothetical protein VX494_10055 [Actinomycetota bacterium]|nr:hypothetical protein [Actinomycetota bacterium]
MRFSEAFQIQRTPSDDWFDPHLTIDTPLFLDPIQLLDYGVHWKRAHQRLVQHFTRCYSLVARATNRTSNSAMLAKRLLTFPEPYEFGLGYTAHGTAGSGSGSGFAESIMDGIAVSIAAGLDEPEHIEEIGILNEGFGADRISDAACNVLKADFIEYTQSVARRHNVSLDLHKVRHANRDLKNDRWVDGEVELPTNPETGRPLILLPRRFLNDLPVLNADDWFESTLNADIRTDMNVKVGQHVAKKTLVKIARQNPDRVREWARQQSSRPDLFGYDFDGDPKGVVQFDGAPVAFAAAHPLALLTPPANQTELSDLVKQVLGQFQHYIEQEGGWSLLWNSDGSEKPESAAQLVFLGMAKHYLRLFDVEVDREVELGRGPVDFKISSGASKRLLIEIKKAHNGKFWNGLDLQLPSYLVSDKATEGWFVAIRYRNNKQSATRMKELPGRVSSAATSSGKTLHYQAVDARRPASASKISP